MTKKFIIFFIFIFYITNLFAENNRYSNLDKGIVSLMYHRFNEDKYPSTNIQMDIFKEHIKIIESLNINFINPKNLNLELNKIHSKKSILLTIDDGYSSFYNYAWPYLKSKKIPFILFISTQQVGKVGYMSWKQINEIQNSNIGEIGNHSHTHDYLVHYDEKSIKSDIDKAINIFENRLGHNPKYFSYPFGEYSLNFINIVKENFEFAFGQHSGVIDLSKDKYQLSRFPINEKYGDLKRFKSIISYLPFYYKSIYPSERYINDENNPPDLKIEFFSKQKNIDKMTCYSNQGNKWRLLSVKNKLIINEGEVYKILLKKIPEKFINKRGRVNCSLNDSEGWRWFGIQFVLSEN